MMIGKMQVANVYVRTQASISGTAHTDEKSVDDGDVAPRWNYHEANNGQHNDNGVFMIALSAGVSGLAGWTTHNAI